MYLCVDYGSRYVGLAATDHEGKISYRYGVIDQKQADVFQRLQEIIEKERIQTVLVGVPIALSGNETQQTQITREFIEKLRIVVPSGVNITEVDETLTSVEASAQIAFEGGDKSLEHAEAARIMLEGFLHQ